MDGGESGRSDLKVPKGPTDRTLKDNAERGASEADFPNPWQGRGKIERPHKLSVFVVEAFRTKTDSLSESPDGSLNHSEMH